MTVNELAKWALMHELGKEFNRYLTMNKQRHASASAMF